MSKSHFKSRTEKSSKIAIAYKESSKLLEFCCRQNYWNFVAAAEVPTLVFTTLQK